MDRLIRCAALALLPFAGCGTLEDLGGNIGGPRVFGGVRRDWHYIRGGDRAWPVIGVFWVIDVPLSLPLDVALLPLTIPLSLSSEDE
jgi:uncharacterized protein YceK